MHNYINNILKTFKIKDKNLKIIKSEKILNKIYTFLSKRNIDPNHENTVVECLLKETVPSCCISCGAKFSSSKDYYKSGFKYQLLINDVSILEQVYLVLAKRQYKCRHCGVKKSVSVDGVKERSRISPKLTARILVDLSTKISMSDIARKYGVSPTTVQNIMYTQKENFNHIINDFSYLPEVLLVDEVTMIKNMSFTVMDGTTRQIIGILENKTQSTIENYFRQYSKKVRENVKHIVVDMNASYHAILPRLFPNAEISIDMFHIIQLLNRALNFSRIDMQNYLDRNSKEYRFIKKNWKLPLSYYDNLDFNNISYDYTYKCNMSTYTKLMKFLNNKIFYETYYFYQDIVKLIKNKDIKGFEQYLKSINIDSVSYRMQTAIKTLKKHKKRIINTFITNYTNGPLEGYHTIVKSVKRIAFGYRRLDNYKLRLYLISKQNKLRKEIKNKF